MDYWKQSDKNSFPPYFLLVETMSPPGLCHLFICFLKEKYGAELIFLFLFFFFPSSQLSEKFIETLFYVKRRKHRLGLIYYSQ